MGWLHNIQLDDGLYDTDRIQTMSYILQTGSPGFSSTHEQLKFTINSYS